MHRIRSTISDTELLRQSDSFVGVNVSGLTFHLVHGNTRQGLVMVNDSVNNYPVCVDGLFDGFMARTVCKSLGFNR